MKIFFVINPAAGRHRSQAAWQNLLDRLDQYGISHAFTQKADDATHLTTAALLKKAELIVSVGGDGTLNECLNGFLKNDKPLQKKATLAMLPFGRGSDFARYLSKGAINRAPTSDLQSFLESLKKKNHRLLDVGKATLCDEKGKKFTRYFLNIANVGLASDVVRLSRQVPKAAGASIAYLYGIVRSMISFKPLSGIYTRGQKEKETKLWNMIIANGQYFAGGIHAAPRAHPDDGLLDIVVIPKLSVSQILLNLPRFLIGEHLTSPDLDYFQAKQMTVTAPSPVPVEMDGEVAGFLPARFEVLPRVLRFKV